MNKTETLKKDKTPQPKYNLWQSSLYMIAIAWKSHKSVLVLCFVLAALSVILSLLGLFIAPTILRNVESAVPLEQLVITILVFAGSMLVIGAVEAYFNVNKKWGRIAIRFKVLSDIHDKISTTSYPNTENQDVRKKLEKAQISNHMEYIHQHFEEYRRFCHIYCVIDYV
jgi:ATP-binding cassette subfamily B protein